MNLIYPSRDEVAASAAKASPHRIDAYSSAEQSEHGLSVTLTAGGVTAVYARVTKAAPGSLPVGTITLNASAARLPQVIVARLNVLLQADGLAVTRDWRSKAHRLQSAPGVVLPLIAGATISSADLASVTAHAPALGKQRAGRKGKRATAPQSALPAPLPAPLPSAVGAGLPASPPPSPYSQRPIVISADNRKRWDMARWAIQNGGEDRVILFRGPSGAGKTHAVYALAATEGLDVWKFDASGVVEPADWFGTVTLSDEGTKFEPSVLLQAILTPGKRVLLVDEANRANGRAMNALIPVLDGSGTFTVPQTGRTEQVNPDVQICWTANIGAEHINVEPLDVAIRTRLATTIPMDHLSEGEEKALILSRFPTISEWDAANLARLGALLRESSKAGAHDPISTRQILAAAKQATAPKADIRIAVNACIVDSYDDAGGDASEKAAVLPHVNGIVWKQPRQPKATASATTDLLCTSTWTSTQTGTRVTCGHDAAAHGVTTGAVALNTRCQQCDCGTYTPKGA